MNYFKDPEGKVYAIYDLWEFWKHCPNIHLIPATYEEFCEFESKQRKEDNELREYYRKKSEATNGEYSPEFLAQEDGLKARDLQ